MGLQMKHKLELHAHTANVSRCAHVRARDMVLHYIDAGYSGLVVTDHFNRELREFIGSDWSTFVHTYLSGYREALDAAGDRLSVYLGMEIRFNENMNDYLVYGFDEDFLFENENLFDLTLKEFRHRYVHGPIRIAQAHPFRTNSTVTEPDLLDGIEVYNGNPRANSRNHFACVWAAYYRKAFLSGSDHHEIEDTARGGILVDRVPRSSSELSDILFLSQNEWIES